MTIRRLVFEFYSRLSDWCWDHKFRRAADYWIDRAIGLLDGMDKQH